MASETSTISFESATFLSSYDEDLTPRNGFIRISRATYSESSEESDWTSTVEIPEKLESVQALQFIGMKKIISELIYSRWARVKRDMPNMPAGFFSFVSAQIGAASINAMTLTDDWDASLKAMGIRKKTRNGILDPAFTHIRLTMSAREWAIDTAEIGWRFLVNLEPNIKKNKAKVIKAHLPTGAATRAGRRSQISTDDTTSENPRSLLTPAAEAPTELPGFQMLYKGADLARFNQLSSPREETRFFGEILTSPPSDFSANVRQLYLTKSRQCAYEYADYVKQRTQGVDVGVLHLAVQNEILNDTQQIFGDDWKAMIWACRGPPGPLPEDLIKYTTMPVLVGEICGSSNEQVQRMASMAEIQPMRLKDGTKPSQHVFQTGEKLAELGARCNFLWVVQLHREVADTEAEGKEDGKEKAKPEGEGKDKEMRSALGTQL